MFYIYNIEKAQNNSIFRANFFIYYSKFISKFVNLLYLIIIYILTNQSAADVTRGAIVLKRTS